MGHGNRRTWGLGVRGVLLVMTLLIAACSDDDTASDDAATDVGLGGCAERPVDCNSGDRADGGTVTWLLSEAWSTYNVLRLEGADTHTAAALAGTAPWIGDFQPDGAWQWNRDLLATDPEITSTDPQTMVYELRPEAVWSDGTPISVDDFRYTWFHQSGREDQCTGCNPKYTVGWEDVASVEGSDDGRTVTITLQDGVTNAEWFALFEPSPYPAHLATAAGFDWHTPEGMGHELRALPRHRAHVVGRPLPDRQRRRRRARRDGPQPAVVRRGAADARADRQGGGSGDGVDARRPERRARRWAPRGSIPTPTRAGRSWTG